MTHRVDWLPRFVAGIKLVDTTTAVTRDGSNNLEFTDAVTGTKTLAELAAPGGLSEDDVKRIAFFMG